VRRALLAWLLAVSAVAAPPGSNRPPDLLQVGVPDQNEAKAVIQQFREAGPARPYYLEFDLELIPRRGAETTTRAHLWGGRNEAGNLLRVEVDPGGKHERRFLLQNGVNATVWESDRHDGAMTETRSVGLDTPLLPGLPIDAFDLGMPFLYWPDARLLSITRVRGRLAHIFVFRPPGNSGVPAQLGAVRAFLDTEFHAPVQIEWVGRDGGVIKTFSLFDMKKVGEEWIPRAIDLRDESTRDKGRFSVTAAALDLNLPPNLFEPADLGQPVAPPLPGRLVRF
jgi:hypothetical protein